MFRTVLMAGACAAGLALTASPAQALTDVSIADEGCFLCPLQHRPYQGLVVVDGAGQDTDIVVEAIDNFADRQQFDVRVRERNDEIGTLRAGNRCHLVGDDITHAICDGAGHMQANLFMGDGSDVVLVANSVDTAGGTTARDHVVGGAGDDRVTIRGADGDSLLEGNEGDDELTGSGGDETMTGGAGNDVLKGGRGADSFTGGDGYDTVSYADHRAGVHAGLTGSRNDGSTDEHDTIRADVEGIDGSPRADTLSGGPGNDVLRGLAGDDHITGAAGNDWIDGGDGADFMSGGTGQDTLSYTGRRRFGVYVRLGRAGAIVGADPTVTGRADEHDHLTAADFERVQGTERNDTLVGSAAPEQFFGNGGDDVLNALGGNDLVDGGPGDDTLYGGPGADVLYGRAGDDSLTSSLDSAVDTLLCGEGTDDALTDAADLVDHGGTDVCENAQIEQADGSRVPRPPGT